MGTSYETLLVAAGFAETLEAVRGTGRSAAVIPVADQRVAVVPREGDYDVADADSLAAALSEHLRGPALAMGVFDSDVVRLVVYRDGEFAHEYLSDPNMLVEYFEDDDGVFKPMIGDVIYPADHEFPEGPTGADPDAFVPFATGAADPERVGAALHADVLMAEDHHRDILVALGLPPAALTVAFRHLDPADFPDAVMVG